MSIEERKRLDPVLAKNWRAWKRLHGGKLLGPKAALQFAEFCFIRTPPVITNDAEQRVARAVRAKELLEGK
jgi:hypothetical protein